MRLTALSLGIRLENEVKITVDRVAPERMVGELHFQNTANYYPFPVYSKNHARKAYRKIIAYLQRRQYHRDGSFSAEEKTELEFECGSLHTKKPDFFRTGSAIFVPRRTMPDQPLNLYFDAVMHEVGHRYGISAEEAHKRLIAPAAAQVTQALPSAAPTIEPVESVEPPAGRLKWGKDNEPDESPAHFAWRAYQVEAQKGTLNRAVIGRDDKLLARDLRNWLRSHPMPDHIDIPTLPEWNDRKVAQLSSAPKAKPSEEERLRAVVYRRANSNHRALTTS